MVQAKSYHEEEIEKQLKPCPFCGYPAEAVYFNMQAGYRVIRCSNEDCMVDSHVTFQAGTWEQMRDHWNRRTT
jgi:hypothetical protein